MGARQLIEKGVRRRIGNGKSTKIWEDSWIPDNHQRKVTTHKPQGCNLVKVDEMKIQKIWNMQLIFRNFSTEEAERILSIHISLVDREDSNFWIFSIDGNYTVSSTYRAQIEGKMEHK